MGTTVIDIPDHIEEKVHAAAAINGITANELLGKAAAHIAKDYDAYLQFRERQERGKGREEEGLSLLRK
ncbi:hypothetical protein SAMN05421890_3981 [Ensifer adhaerens]|nr:hypothetical protein SAMN05421890_3981 [Ensifer adhaerens]